MFSVFRNVTIPGTSHILLKVTWWEGGSCRRIVHHTHTHTHNQMYAAISAKRQVAGQHLCFIMLRECQWSSPVPYQLSQWFLSKAQVNQSQAAACWSLLEGRAGADRFHPPYPCSLKKSKKKKPWQSAKFRRGCGWFKLEEGKANNVQIYSSHWWEREKGQLLVSRFPYMCLFFVFVHIVLIAVFVRAA